ncbi:hypothetical protein [Haloarchaeobius salinus]|uniref:hypothetical protein n=1 Tax=Haloarchaeobius salinus TaxID=1198298 RepID=UPI0021093ECE|nr:hypothetical protein [Haloarchaeobius salinus]
MATPAASLTEPTVLAHTKRRLFPDDSEGSYAVVDTQFARTNWVAGAAIPAEVTEALAPFNHVQVGSGYPDLVGVRTLEADLLAVERFGENPPLVAVEAKGYTETGGVDVERGIVQAYDRLHEANAAYVAAPIRAISQSDRTLARELNVGVLGVDESGSVTTLELPRVVGNRTAGEATAIRFQASAQGVADQSFGLNHPKNYLAYPVALALDGDTESLLAEHVVAATDSARGGASFLGLVDIAGPREELTPLGREVVRFARREHGDLDAAIRTFEDWKRSRTRFYDLAPRWGLLTRRVVFDYPATQLLVEELQHLHDDGFSEPSLPRFVRYLHELHPSVTVELFLRGDEDVRERALTADGELRDEPLHDGAMYHSPTVFQLKALLYHAGILTERGREPSRLTPDEDVWALRDRA